jgi:hypothetical protein
MSEETYGVDAPMFGSKPQAFNPIAQEATPEETPQQVIKFLLATPTRLEILLISAGLGVSSMLHILTILITVFKV